MQQNIRGSWLVVDWVSYVFGFNLVDAQGEIKVVETGNTLEIWSVINGVETALGSLNIHTRSDQPLVVAFSALNAAPNIRFKYKRVDVHRQVELPLFANTGFNIIAPGGIVQAVMIVDLVGSVLG